MNLHEQNKPPPFPFLLNMFMHTYSTLLPDVQGQQPQTDQVSLSAAWVVAIALIARHTANVFGQLDFQLLRNIRGNMFL